MPEQATQVLLAQGVADKLVGGGGGLVFDKVEKLGSALAAHRHVERDDRLAGEPAHLAHLGHVDVQLGRELVARGLATQGRRQAPLDDGQPVHLLDHVHGYADGAALVG